MSDYKLKKEIESIIAKSGYEKNKALVCPITKVMTMRHQELKAGYVVKVIKSLL